MKQFPINMRLLIIFANSATFICNQSYKFIFAIVGLLHAMFPGSDTFEMLVKNLTMQEYLSLDRRRWRKMNDDTALFSLFDCKIMLMDRILGLLPIYIGCCWLVIALLVQ